MRWVYKFLFALSLLAGVSHAASYGPYSRGCFTNGDSLPESGPGFFSIQRQRDTFHGHPDTVNFVKSLGQKAEQEKLGVVRVGNIAQKNGGPLYEHSVSHQSGLDVDIGYVFSKKKSGEVLVDVLKKDRSINTKLFTKESERLIQLTAQDKKVQRILVNPIIKKKMCETYPDQKWLRKLRPWWKHTDHMHVRLHCPKDSPECVKQSPVPAGTGCSGDQFEWWFSQEAEDMRTGKIKKGSGSSSKKKKPKPYPAKCQEVLGLKP